MILVTGIFIYIIGAVVGYFIGRRYRKTHFEIRLLETCAAILDEVHERTFDGHYVYPERRELEAISRLLEELC